MFRPLNQKPPAQSDQELQSIAENLGSVEIKPHWAKDAKARAEAEKASRAEGPRGVSVMTGGALAYELRAPKTEDPMAARVSEALEKGRAGVIEGRAMRYERRSE